MKKSRQRIISTILAGGCIISAIPNNIVFAAETNISSNVEVSANNGIENGSLVIEQEEKEDYDENYKNFNYSQYIKSDDGTQYYPKFIKTTDHSDAYISVISNEGDIYVYDKENGISTIKKYNKNKELIYSKEYGGIVLVPSINGELYIIQGNKKIIKLNSNGEEIFSKTYSNNFYNYYYYNVTNNGDLVYCHSNIVDIYNNTTGEVISKTLYSTSDYSAYSTIISNDSIYTALRTPINSNGDYNIVLNKYNLEGTLEWTRNLGSFNKNTNGLYPQKICADSSNNIWVTMNSSTTDVSSKMYVINPNDGSEITNFETKTNSTLKSLVRIGDYMALKVDANSYDFYDLSYNKIKNISFSHTTKYNGQEIKLYNNNNGEIIGGTYITQNDGFSYDYLYNKNKFTLFSLTTSIEDVDINIKKNLSNETREVIKSITNDDTTYSLVKSKDDPSITYLNIKHGFMDIDYAQFNTNDIIDLYEENSICVKVKNSQDNYIYKYNFDYETGVTKTEEVYEKYSFKGEGTQENPYLITSKEDLLSLANDVNKIGIDYSENYFEFTNDIDMTSVDWEGIKGSIGYVIGNNHTIKNLSGSFGLIHEIKYSISDLHLENIQINYNGNCQYKGSLVNSLLENATITNCSASGTIISDGKEDALGGLVGYLSIKSQIANCIFNGNITNSKLTGGVVGKTHQMVNVNKCLFDGKIDNSNITGGICGYFIGSEISESVSKGKLKGNRVGGISYNTNGTIVRDCLSSCDIEVDNADYVGGIAVTTNTNGIATNRCLYTGSILFNNITFKIDPIAPIVWNYSTGCYYINDKYLGNALDTSIGVTTEQAINENAKKNLGGLFMSSAWTTTDGFPTLKWYKEYLDKIGGGSSSGGSSSEDIKETRDIYGSITLKDNSIINAIKIENGIILSQIKDKKITDKVTLENTKYVDMKSTEDGGYTLTIIKEDGKKYLQKYSKDSELLSEDLIGMEISSGSNVTINITINADSNSTTITTPKGDTTIDNFKPSDSSNTGNGGSLIEGTGKDDKEEIIVVTPSGDVISGGTINVPGYENTRLLAYLELSNGNILVAGAAGDKIDESVLKGISTYSTTPLDGLMVEFSPQGKQLSIKIIPATYGAKEDATITGLKELKDNVVVISGDTLSPTNANTPTFEDTRELVDSVTLKTGETISIVKDKIEEDTYVVKTSNSIYQYDVSTYRNVKNISITPKGDNDVTIEVEDKDGNTKKDTVDSTGKVTPDSTTSDGDNKGDTPSGGSSSESGSTGDGGNTTNPSKPSGDKGDTPSGGAIGDGDSSSENKKNPTIEKQEVIFDISKPSDVTINGIVLNGTNISSIKINGVSYGIVSTPSTLNLLRESRNEITVEDGKFIISSDIIQESNVKEGNTYDIEVTFDDGTVITKTISLKVINSSTSSGETTPDTPSNPSGDNGNTSSGGSTGDDENTTDPSKPSGDKGDTPSGGNDNSGDNNNPTINNSSNDKENSSSLNTINKGDNLSNKTKETNSISNAPKTGDMAKTSSTLIGLLLSLLGMFSFKKRRK